jgi:hypothetical protein
MYYISDYPIKEGKIISLDDNCGKPLLVYDFDNILISEIKCNYIYEVDIPSNISLKERFFSNTFILGFDSFSYSGCEVSCLRIKNKVNLNDNIDKILDFFINNPSTNDRTIVFLILNNLFDVIDVLVSKLNFKQFYDVDYIRILYDGYFSELKNNEISDNLFNFLKKHIGNKDSAKKLMYVYIKDGRLEYVKELHKKYNLKIGYSAFKLACNQTVEYVQYCLDNMDNRQLNVVKNLLLIDEFPEINLDVLKKIINLKKQYLNNYIKLVYRAIECENFDIIEYLLDFIPDTKKFDSTLIFRLCEHNQIRLIDIIISKGFNIHPHIQQLLNCCNKFGRLELSELLLEVK